MFPSRSRQAFQAATPCLSIATYSSFAIEAPRSSEQLIIASTVSAVAHANDGEVADVIRQCSAALLAQLAQHVGRRISEVVTNGLDLALGHIVEVRATVENDFVGGHGLISTYRFVVT